MKTPITDNMDIIEYPKGEYPIAGDKWVPIDDCRQLEKDRAELLKSLKAIIDLPRPVYAEGSAADTFWRKAREVIEKMEGV